MPMQRSDDRVRQLSVADMELPLPESGALADLDIDLSPAPAPVSPPLPKDDPFLRTTLQLMKDGYAGAILSGPPGTGKTWYARKLALALSGEDEECVAFVQFHPSYQYEDFVQGYVPAASGFILQPKVFATLCASALENPDRQYVLVIDEFSRTDAARVFGEILTYIETSKRGMSFTLQSGDNFVVPANLFLIATMNPWDKGVDDMDVALERRFATIDFLPDRDSLSKMITGTELSESTQNGLLRFFEAIQHIDNEHCHVGHAYFAYVTDADSLSRLWQYRLNPHFRRSCRADKALLKRIESMWAQMVVNTYSQGGAAGEGPPEPTAASSESTT